MQTTLLSQPLRPLTASDLVQVNGGLNPQPLPPREASRFLYAGTLHSVYVDGLYWGDYYFG